MGEGIPTLERGRGYLSLMGVPGLDGRGVPTLDGGGVPTLDRRGGYLSLMGYLPWMEAGGTYLGQVRGVPTLDGGGSMYLGWGEGGGTYLGCVGGLPTLERFMPLVASRRRTFF